MTPITIDYIAEALQLTLDEIKIQPSIMSGKLEQLVAINSSPTGNPFCEMMSQRPELICSVCYSIAMVKTHRKNADLLWQKTMAIMALGILPKVMIPKINVAYMRGDAHGELINVYSLLNLWQIADKNPHATLSIWTKRKDLVRQALTARTMPNNVIMIYSEPRKNVINRTVPKNFHKVFSCIENDSPEINCGSNKCFDCMKCYRHNEQDPTNQTVLIEQITTQQTRVKRFKNKG